MLYDKFSLHHRCFLVFSLPVDPGRSRLGNGIEAVGIDSGSVWNKIVQNLGIENVV